MIWTRWSYWCIFTGSAIYIQFYEPNNLLYYYRRYNYGNNSKGGIQSRKKKIICPKVRLGYRLVKFFKGKILFFPKLLRIKPKASQKLIAVTFGQFTASLFSFERPGGLKRCAAEHTASAHRVLLIWSTSRNSREHLDDTRSLKE